MDYSKQRIKVCSITQVNKDVRCYRFVSAEEGIELQGFSAGQYINIFYKIGDTTTSRPYSIASSPREAVEEGFYELYIRGGGFTSVWLFKNADVGAVFEASMPMGEFCIDSTSEGSIIAISGGMSITPLRSMARAVAQGSVNARLCLFCGFNRVEELLFYDELMELAASCESLDVVFAVANERVEGMVYGHITRELLCNKADTTNAEYFVCGSDEMYKFLESELYPLHIPSAKYHTELPGEVWQGAASQLTDDIRVFTLTVDIRGEIHKAAMRSDETILLALERSGLEPESRCRSGRCKFCVAVLLEGMVYVDPSRERRSTMEIARGLINTCCTFPLSDVSLKVNI